PLLEEYCAAEWIARQFGDRHNEWTGFFSSLHEQPPERQRLMRFLSFLVASLQQSSDYPDLKAEVEELDRRIAKLATAPDAESDGVKQKIDGPPPAPVSPQFLSAPRG